MSVYSQLPALITLIVLCAAALASARPLDRRNAVLTQSESGARRTTLLDDRSTQLPSSGADKSKREENNPCLNVPANSNHSHQLQPPAECIHNLRRKGKNYRNMLFAVAETLELEFSEVSQERRKRGSTDNQCRDIVGDINGVAVPRNTMCPFTFECAYHETEDGLTHYPRYTISASCNGVDSQCAEYGRVSVVTLKPVKSESCADEGSGSGCVNVINWTEVTHTNLYHGCQVVMS